MRLARVALLLVIGLAAPLRAQATPEEAVMQYTNALRASDFAGAARMMHPDAIRQMRELFDPMVGTAAFGEVGPQMFGVKTSEEWAKLADTTMFAAFLRSMLGQQAELAEAMRSSKTTVLGHVVGGTDTTYVVARIEMSISEVSLTQFEVMPTALYQGKWRCLLKADFSNIAAMLRRAIAAEPRA